MCRSYFNKPLGPDEVIPLFYDKVFKLTFGDVHHLERINLVLSTILKKDVKVINLLNTELIGDNRVNKKNTVDLVCELDNEYVSIEVNTSFGQTVIDRNLSFLFRLESKGLHPNDSYKDISKYYQINLNTVDFDNEHFNTCHIKSDNSGQKYSDIIEIININVVYYAKLCYTIDEEKLTDEDKVLGIIGTDKKSVIDKIVSNDQVLKEIGNMAQFFSSDDEIIFEYDRDQLMMDDMKEVLTKEVTEATSKEIAKNFLNAGADIDMIVSATGLSKEEVELLKLQES